MIRGWCLRADHVEPMNQAYISRAEPLLGPASSGRYCTESDPRKAKGIGAIVREPSTGGFIPLAQARRFGYETEEDRSSREQYEAETRRAREAAFQAAKSERLIRARQPKSIGDKGCRGYGEFRHVSYVEAEANGRIKISIVDAHDSYGNRPGGFSQTIEWAAPIEWTLCTIMERQR